MESSGAATTYYKSGPNDAMSSPGPGPRSRSGSINRSRSGSVDKGKVGSGLGSDSDSVSANGQVMSWTRDVLSTLGLDFSLMGSGSGSGTRTISI